MREFSLFKLFHGLRQSEYAEKSRILNSVFFADRKVVKMKQKILKDVFLEIAEKRGTNIRGLADIIGVTNAALYRQIKTGNFTRLTLKKFIDKLNLTSEEITEIITVRSEDEYAREILKIQEKKTGE